MRGKATLFAELQRIRHKRRIRDPRIWSSLSVQSQWTPQWNEFHSRDGMVACLPKQLDFGRWTRFSPLASAIIAVGKSEARREEECCTTKKFTVRLLVDSPLLGSSFLSIPHFDFRAFHSLWRRLHLLVRPVLIEKRDYSSMEPLEISRHKLKLIHIALTSFEDPIPSPPELFSSRHEAASTLMTCSLSLSLALSSQVTFSRQIMLLGSVRWKTKNWNEKK